MYRHPDVDVVVAEGPSAMPVGLPEQETKCPQASGIGRQQKHPAPRREAGDLEGKKHSVLMHGASAGPGGERPGRMGSFTSRP